MTIIQSKNRSGRELDPFDLKIETDEDTSFRFIYEGEAKPMDKLSKATELLLVWFAESSIISFETKQAMTICSSKEIKRQNCYNALAELIKRGEITKSEKGVYSVNIQKKLRLDSSPSPIL